MSATIATARPEAVAARSTFLALAVRELRRFVVNPVFLIAVTLTTWIALAANGSVTEIDEVNGNPAVLLGGFGMMATYWLTRSMRDSEPVVGVTPTTLPVRTGALCTVAIVPFLCGWLTLFAFLHTYPVGSPFYGAFSSPAQVAILVGQIVLPSLGGPLLGVALGRWVSFPGAAFVLFLLIFGWLQGVTVLTLLHPGPAAFVALRMFSPFAFWTVVDPAPGVTSWRGSPWFFLGWQLALCAIAVLVALLRGAEGRVRLRVIRTLQIVLVVAAILLVLASVGGFSHAVNP
jgi:hypothetical protein